MHVDESDYIAARISNLVEFCISPGERLGEDSRISVQGGNLIEWLFFGLLFGQLFRTIFGAFLHY